MSEKQTGMKSESVIIDEGRIGGDFIVVGDILFVEGKCPLLVIEEGNDFWAICANFGWCHSGKDNGPCEFKMRLEPIANAAAIDRTKSTREAPKKVRSA